MSIFGHSFLPIFFLILATFCAKTILAFEALPFLQIDPQFYLRLAQCQAKCWQKFQMKRELPEAAMEMERQMQIVDEQNADSLKELCHQGCLDSDSPSPLVSASHQTPQSAAFAQGQHFFRQSALLAPNSNSPQHRRRALRIRPLCAQRMPLSMDSPSEKFEAIFVVDLDMENEEKDGDGGEGHWKFVISWRRRMGAMGNLEADAEKMMEPKWITASIEPSRTFRVTGLRGGGLLHQFRVQPVSVNGPLGPSVLSDWIDFGQLAAGNGDDNSQMERTVALGFFSQFNAEYGVAAWMRWNRKEGPEANGDHQLTKPVLNYRLRRSAEHSSAPTTMLAIVHSKGSASSGTPSTNPPNQPIPAAVIFPACQLQLEWANKSSRMVEDVELDGSDGFLLPHLAFNSAYSVRIFAQLDDSTRRPLLQGTFLSMHCAQVFGAGSLECEPESPRHISIRQFPGNGSALISWERPEAVGNILLYELGIEPIKDTSGECQVRPSARIVSAQSNSALISLPQTAICEFEIRLTLYDLLGREAAAFSRFQFVPAGHLPKFDSANSSAFGQLFGQMEPSTGMALLVVLILVPTMAILTLLCTFWRQAGSRAQKIAAKQQKERKREGGEKSGKIGRGSRELEGNEGKTSSTKSAASSNGSPCNSPQSSLASACGTEITTTLVLGRQTMAKTDEEELEGEGTKRMMAKRNWRWRMAKDGGMPAKMTTVALGEV